MWAHSCFSYPFWTWETTDHYPQYENSFCICILIVIKYLLRLSHTKSSKFLQYFLGHVFYICMHFCCSFLDFLQARDTSYLQYPKIDAEYSRWHLTKAEWSQRIISKDLHTICLLIHHGILVFLSNIIFLTCIQH